MKGAWCWALLCLAAACLLCHAGAAADDRETAGDQMNTIGDDDEKYLGTDIFDNTIEGRGKKKNMLKMLMTIKMMLVSFLVPKVIGLALFASWKGITISLIAFTVAIIAALKHAQTSQSNDNKSVQHIFVKKDPGNDHHHHEHWWRRIREAKPAHHFSDHSDHHSDHYDIHPSDMAYQGWDDEKR
ncbi:Hypothetical protein NTJ_09562 [Nesidiocoris tenuis]|uniref:Uncharacterized protein n=1 Tax=Nesidiocoris tenuis TaxID=355587 RepID=A0ABN7AZJ7_9HEMI|nr:Hypothetical protein NTJ_09562 [Nesidiocoris tenuis]